MGRIILVLCLLISSVVSAQPGYTNINARYKWIAGGFDSSLILPRYGGVPSGLRSAWNTDGQLAVDTANNHLYVYSGGAWVRIANYSDVGSTYTFPYSVVAPGNAIQLENDTTANPANYFYGRNSAGRRGWYPQSGIVGVNIFNSDGTLTDYRVINGNYKGFEMSNISSLSIGVDDNTDITGAINIGGGIPDNISQIYSKSSSYENGVYGFRGVNKLYGVTLGDTSFVEVDGANGISIKAFDGSLRIPLLNYTLSTTGKKIMLRDTATGLVENIDPALIGTSLTFTSPLNESGGVVDLGGLSGFGSSGQLLSSTGAGLQYINQSSITGVNIYNSNGQATANRVFIGNGKTLNFNNFVGVTFDTSKVTIRTSTGFDAVGDSSFNVFNGGIHTSRGVRHDNLPYTLNITGKKISVIDTANGGTMYTIDPALIGGGITVGTTTITSGTNGRIAYNNAGVYGEKAVTGTGDVVLATSPTLVTPNIGVASGTSLTLSGLTTRRVLYNNDGLIKDTSAFTYSSSGELLVNTTTDLGNYNLQVGGQMASQRYDLYASGGGLLGGLINNSGYMALNSSSLMALLGSSDIWINAGVDIAMSPRVAIGSSLGAFTATARLHIVGGTATANTAPLKFTSGTNLTTAEAGAMEYNGTNLFFTPSSAARNSILMTASVNSVSPTSPNRTITVVIDGTTYYISAKTTND